MLWSKVYHSHCYGQNNVTFNVMVKSMYCMSQSVLWSKVCMSQLMLWSKVCHSQCYGQRYVTFSVMLKSMSHSMVWSNVCIVCHSVMVKSMYVTINVMVKSMSQSILWSKVCHSQCYGQKNICHS